ncbi:MAG: hypothetical protein RBR53_07030 [Desulforegulaceae bacterium]|nr:hypothetical protein [Desulforegulaceae bacterium]
MKNKKDLITGIVLLAASIAVIVKFFVQRQELEAITGSVFFVNLSFVIFSLLLGGAGIKKIFFPKNKIKPDNSDRDNRDI